jgi:arylsulfatase A-like enzyme
VPQGEVRDQMVTGCDWLPTIAAYTGPPLPKRLLDGRNIRPVIESREAPSPHDRFYWLLGRGSSARWAVRQGDWKLLGNPRDPRAPDSLTEDDKLFLVNLKSDPSEAENRAAGHPDRVKKLRSIHLRYQGSLAKGEK